MKTPCIGIDLGTTYSCATTFINNNVEVICDSQDGKRTIPSVVAFNDDGSTVVGNSAIFRKAGDPANVFYDSKRLIGRNFDDEKVQKTMKNATFKLVRFNEATGKREEKEMPNVTDNIRYHRKSKGKEADTDLIAPRVVSAEILRNIANSAANVLGEVPRHAVITVPAYFGHQQRQTTELAAKKAGFTHVRLVNEPVAAGMAYGYQRIKNNDRLTEDKTVMIFDLGGGTFDVSVVMYNAVEGKEAGMAENLGSSGDDFLGGRNFDDVIFNLAITDFLKKNPEIKESEIKERSKRRLLIECERIKCELSFLTNSTLIVECFHGDVDLNVNISRYRFEELCAPFFKRCITEVELCLAQYAGGTIDLQSTEAGRKWVNRESLLSKIEEAKKKIDNVILVGGSSRIPAVQKMLRDFFGETEQNTRVCMPLNPDEAIAVGAGYLAAQVYNPESLQPSEKLMLVDAASFTVGIEVAGGLMAELVKKGSNLPIRNSQIFSTFANNQTSVEVKIFTGEFKMCKENHLMGSFSLTGIAPEPAGVPQIEVTVDVDETGTINLSAVDKKGGGKQEITITNVLEKIGSETQQVEDAVLEAAKKADELNAKRAEISTNYEKLINDAELVDKQIYEAHRKWRAENGEPTNEELEERIKMIVSEIGAKKGAPAG